MAMKKLGKKILYVILVVLLISILYNTAFGVQVVDISNSQPSIEENTIKSIAILVLTFGFLGLLFLGGVGLFAWILWKIWVKLTEHYRKNKNFIYEIFSYDIMQCHYNADKSMKKRNWKLLWFFWKRRPIYVEKKDGTLEVIGLYHGECYKKEGFYLIGIYNKISLFKYIGQIIMIPLPMKKKIVKTIEGDGAKTLFLSCEGIDYIEGSDFYLIPLIPENPENDKFIDLNDMIHKTYFEVTTYRDVITSNLLSYRKSIIQSIETNPFVHFGRRGGENFKKK